MTNDIIGMPKLASVDCNGITIDIPNIYTEDAEKNFNKNFIHILRYLGLIGEPINLENKRKINEAITAAMFRTLVSLGKEKILRRPDLLREVS